MCAWAATSASALSWILLDDLSEESITRILTEGTPAAVGDIVEVDMNRNSKRVVYLLVASLDADGYIQKLVYAELTHPEARADEWIPIGTGHMTEGFLSCLSLAPFSSETFEVEVEENKYLKGYYRLKDPYKAWSQTSPTTKATAIATIFTSMPTIPKRYMWNTAFSASM